MCKIYLFCINIFIKEFLVIFTTWFGILQVEINKKLKCLNDIFIRVKTGNSCNTILVCWHWSPHTFPLYITHLPIFTMPAKAEDIMKGFKLYLWLHGFKKYSKYIDHKARFPSISIWLSRQWQLRLPEVSALSIQVWPQRFRPWRFRPPYMKMSDFCQFLFRYSFYPCSQLSLIEFQDYGKTVRNKTPTWTPTEI